MNLYEQYEFQCCDFCVNNKIKRDFSCCNHFVFRLNSKCNDNRTKKLLEGLINMIPFVCYFKIVKVNGNVLACLQ